MWFELYVSFNALLQVSPYLRQQNYKKKTTLYIAALHIFISSLRATEYLAFKNAFKQIDRSVIAPMNCTSDSNKSQISIKTGVTTECIYIYFFYSVHYFTQYMLHCFCYTGPAFRKPFFTQLCSCENWSLSEFCLDYPVPRHNVTEWHSTDLGAVMTPV